MRGMPTIHSSAPVDLAPRLEQHVEALVGAQQAEEQHDRALARRAARRAAAAAAAPPRGAARREGSRARARVDAELVDQAPRGRALVRDDRVHALDTAAAGRRAARARLARQHVVGGSTSGLAAREQVNVERLDGQPLEVHDVGLAARARR